VLSQLADDHNEELGIAWPSMKDLARRSCLSERGCRKVVAALESKGVIRRIATRRREGGGQSSNEYEFLALDQPKVTAKQVESRRRFQRVTRVPMYKQTGGPDRKSPPVAERKDRGSLTSETGGPGTIVPPIEHLGDLSREPVAEHSQERFPPTPRNKARGMQGKSAVVTQDKPQQLASLYLMRIGWGAAVDSVYDAMMATVPVMLESRPGYRNGFLDWQEYRFADLGAESAEEVGADTLLLRVSSPDPDATRAGLEKYKDRWDKALKAAFGRPVKLEICRQTP